MRIDSGLLEPSEVRDKKAEAPTIAFEAEPASVVEQAHEQSEAEMLRTAEQTLRELFAAQQTGLKQIEAAAASGGELDLSPEEITQGKKASSLTEGLRVIGEKVTELKDVLRNKWIDRKISRTIKEISGYNYRYFTHGLADLLPKLTTKDLLRNQEFVTAITQRFAKELVWLASQRRIEFTGYEGEDWDCALKIIKLLKSHVQILDQLLADPEVQSAQEKIIRNCLGDYKNQKEVPRVAQELHMNFGRVKNIARQAVIETATIDPMTGHTVPEIGHTGGQITGYTKPVSVSDLSQAMIDFDFDAEFKGKLAIEYLLIKIKNLEDLKLEDLKKDFNLSGQELKELAGSNPDVFKKAIYQNWTERLSCSRDFGAITTYYKETLDVTISLEDFRINPDAQTMLRKKILQRAAMGIMFPKYDPDTYQILESLSTIPLTQVLESDEGTTALRQGLRNIVSSGQIDYLAEMETLFPVITQEFLQSGESKTLFYQQAQQLIYKGDLYLLQQLIKKGNLDLEVIRADQATVQNIRKLITESTRREYLHWPQNLMAFLGILETEFKNLKLELISTCIKNREFGMAWQLITQAPLEAADNDYIAQHVFGTTEAVAYVATIIRICSQSFNLKVFATLITDYNRFSQKTPEQLSVYLSISEKIIHSPAQEIIRLKDQLIEQILTTDNPEQAYEAINNIFVRNNLPTVGKVMKVFEILYPPPRTADLVTGKTSPVLQRASPNRRRHIFFNDLLKIHIETGNRSLKHFLEVLTEGDTLIVRLEQDPSSLTTEEEEKLWHILRKFKTVSDTSLRGQRQPNQLLSRESLVAACQDITSQLGVKQGQTMTERVIDMYARPLGFKTVDQVLETMETARVTADQRGRCLAQRKIELTANDLVKGVDTEYFDNLLQNGLVAREFLGASSDSDQTPFDTDVELITPDPKLSFATNYEQAVVISKGYGKALIVIKNREQFQTTTAAAASYQRSGYELFKTSVMGDAHYGIRTGIPATEIDFIILKDPSDKLGLEKMQYSIAQNGYYIPIVDTAGTVVFTPAMFDECRQVFAGVERFNGAPLPFVSSAGEPYVTELQAIMEAKKTDVERLQALKKDIRSLVVDVLGTFDISLKAEYEDGLLGAELLDTGSTGRGTNSPGEGDFDLTLKLDAQDYNQVTAIGEKIIEQLGLVMTEKPLFKEQNGNYLLRFFGSQAFGAEGADIDIVFIKKSDLNVYGSHDAISDKLDNIREEHGEPAYQETVANILLAKKWLKAGQVYKKRDYGEGGLGGIGVENLVLAYGGNVGQAFRAFYQAAQSDNGSTKTFTQFKQGFKLLDAGLDMRSNRYDNFMENLTEIGYQKMLRLIEQKFPPHNYR